MKRQSHQCLLGLSLFVIIPGALLGMLLSIAVVATGLQSKFAPTDPLAITLFLIPSILSWWGVKLFFRLYVGFLKRVRIVLIWFYASTLVYCGMWLFSTFSRDGIGGTIFGSREQVIGSMLLLVPLIAVIFTYPDSESPYINKTKKQNNKGCCGG